MMKRHMTFIACALSLLSACSFDHSPQSVKVSAGASPPIARASASAVVSGPPAQAPTSSDAELASTATLTASPAATSRSLGCTAWWEDGASGPLEPESCSESVPWWSTWGNCSMTPIHSEPWAHQEGLRRLPWVQAEPTTAGIVGHLYYGNRPLHTNGKFPDGTDTKVLWTFARPITRFKATAIDLSSTASAMTLWDRSTTEGAEAWPSGIDLPSAGCWRIDLATTDADGMSSVSSVTLIVIGD